MQTRESAKGKGGRRNLGVDANQFAEADAMAEDVMPEKAWLRRRHPEAVRKVFGGRNALLIQLRGDWEFYGQVCGLPRWDAERCMCWICKALDGYQFI